MAHSHVDDLVVKSLSVGSAGAEVVVIDSDGFLTQPKSHTTTVTGGPGTASRMPANPVGYLSIKIGDEVFSVPFFKA